MLILRKRKCRENDNLIPERTGENIGDITVSWFQDDFGIARPELKTGGVHGECMQVSYSLN